MIVATTLGRAAESNWVYLVSNQTLKGSVDITSIQVRDGKQSAWVLWDYNELQELSVAGKSQMYYSAKALSVFDCANEKYAIVSQIYYGGVSGEGVIVDSWNKPIGSTELVPVVPDSLASGILKFVCAVETARKEMQRLQSAPKPSRKAKPKARPPQTDT